MARNYCSEINLHCTWHCKESAPSSTPQVEPVAQRLIHERIVTTPGVFVHEIGGTDTHIHVALDDTADVDDQRIREADQRGDFHEVNEQFALRGKVLQWQAGYGVVSFGTRAIWNGSGNTYGISAANTTPRERRWTGWTD